MGLVDETRARVENARSVTRCAEIRQLDQCIAFAEQKRGPVRGNPTDEIPLRGRFAGREGEQRVDLDTGVGGMGPRGVDGASFLIDTVVALTGPPQNSGDMDAIPAEEVRGIDQQGTPFLGLYVEARNDGVGKGQSCIIG